MYQKTTPVTETHHNITNSIDRHAIKAVKIDLATDLFNSYIVTVI